MDDRLMVLFYAVLISFFCRHVLLWQLHKRFGGDKKLMEATHTTSSFIVFWGVLYVLAVPAFTAVKLIKNVKLR